MHRIREKHGAIAAAMLAVAGVLAQPMAAQVRSFHFDMRDQSLSQALQQYGQVSGQQIVFTEALVADLQEHCRRETAPYKYPRLIEFTDELPKTASGKIRRAELRAQAARASS